MGLYQAALEVFQSLVTPSAYSLETIINNGIVRTICYCLINFKALSDTELTSFFENTILKQDSPPN